MAGARGAQATRSGWGSPTKAVTERVIPRPEDSYHTQRLTARSLHDICATLRYSIQSQHDARSLKFEKHEKAQGIARTELDRLRWRQEWLEMFVQSKLDDGGTLSGVLG